MGISLYTWNVNGLRSILGKGLGDFLKTESPDILCLQEIKCDDLSFISEAFSSSGYRYVANPAKRKGYSGTLTLWKNELELDVVEDSDIGIDEELRDEGRVVEVVVSGLRLLNLYIPSGSSSEERQERKFHFLEQFKTYLSGLSDKERGRIIMCGDFNICHQEIDIHHPKEASKKMLSGFLPEERTWFSDLLSLGFTDIYRDRYPDKQQFTWWSYRAGARGKNLGWRLDYFLCGSHALKQCEEISILGSVMGSDHCPVRLRCAV